MTTAEVATMIAGIGVPYAYYQFPEGTAQACPFVCFYYPESDDFMADDSNYVHIVPLTIELYTDNIDFTKRAAVESALDTAGLPYSWTETWIDSERMHMTTYNTEVILTTATEAFT